MTTIPNPTPVNPQLLPTPHNNLAHSNILSSKKIVRTAPSSDTYHAHDIQHKNYPKNHEIISVIMKVIMGGHDLTSPTWE